MRPAIVVLVVLLAGCASAPEPDAPVSVGESPSPSPSRSPSAPSPSSPSPAAPSAPGPQSPWMSGRFAGCSGEGPVMFNTSPMREEDFDVLLPYGLLAGAHVTPIDHMYLSPPFGSARDAFEVRAIADGVIYNLQPRDINVDTGASRAREWRMDIAHTCTFTSYFDLLTSLDPAIESAMSAAREGRAPAIPIRAGQVVGRIGAQTLDFGVYDYNVTLPGFVVPQHYASEPWKVHTVDPFPYFEEPIRSMLLAKDIRLAEPRAGRIDQDVDGRLVGNWFAQGTRGYGGLRQSDYWEGHLAIVHDAIVPELVRFSIGNFSGRAQQFAVKGNAPDPGDVTVESGLIEYELVRSDYYEVDDPSRNGMGPGGVRPGHAIAAREAAQVEGVALIQMLGPRLAKVEVFPGMTATQVEGFTLAARLYER